MKNKKHLSLALILILLISYSVFVCNVFAHSGRTDANGGHWNRSTGEYHYHTGEYAGRTQSSSYKEPLPDESTKKYNILFFVVPFLAVVCFYFLYVKIFRKRNGYSMSLKEVNNTRAEDFTDRVHKKHSERPKKIKNTFCSVVAVIILFVSMGSALQDLVVHYGKGIAVTYFLLWFWAFDYAFQKDSKSIRISELEYENEVLKNILENYKNSDEQLQTNIPENAKNAPRNLCIIPDDVVFDDRNLPVRTSRSKKKKVNYGKDFNAFLVKGGTLYHKKSCKKLKGKKITTKHIYECIADKNKKPCPVCKPRTKTHEWYNAKFPDSPYAKASNYDKEEQLSLFDDVDA